MQRKLPKCTKLLPKGEVFKQLVNLYGFQKKNTSFHGFQLRVSTSFGFRQTGCKISAFRKGLERGFLGSEVHNSPRCGDFRKMKGSDPWKSHQFWWFGKHRTIPMWLSEWLEFSMVLDFPGWWIRRSPLEVSSSGFVTSLVARRISSIKQETTVPPSSFASEPALKPAPQDKACND